jgi:CRP/FNR family cyclic AMP-dependent transcriptional regulator
MSQQTPVDGARVNNLVSRLVVRSVDDLVDVRSVGENQIRKFDVELGSTGFKAKSRVHQDILATLKKIPFFAEIAEPVLGKLADGAVIKNFNKNVVIINEGDEAGPLFIILSGKVRVFLSNEDGKVVTLSEQKEGSYFGELSLLDHEPRSASVMTLEPTTCALIPKPTFGSWVGAYPEEAGLALIRGLTKRVRMLTENVRSLALSDVYGRLVKVLNDIADPVEGEVGQWVVEGKISHQELANLVGSSREMISRILKDLSRGGYVVKDGKKMRILRRLPASW